jgi:ABC-type branched-subunit amino acid transport system substrate-binding protein
MARYAERAGFVRVAVINSRAPESTEEADAFTAALSQTGVALAGRFEYNAGATYFGDQIKGAREALRGEEIRALGLAPEDTLHVELLQPVAVFLPIPTEDVELVAPQVTFFGLDTLAIRTLGTSGWTDAQTLSTVDQRHTNGVIATAPIDAGPGSAGYARFRDAFEGHFRRTLVSRVPALGYDAALLLLEATRHGARTPAEVRSALERIRDVEGATGTFSIVDGRVERRTHIVQIEHGTFIPAG